jgi:HK97 family phage prohead protease
MPIPKPRTNESRQQFMSRCMGDKTMTDEYNPNQRMAVCSSQYKSKEEESSESKREIRKDVFTTEEEALKRAEEIGCVGSHSHDEDGNTIYMPCETHTDYVRAMGEDVKESDSKESDEPVEMFDDLEPMIVKTEIKAIDNEDEEEGSFEGYASVFGKADLGNDVVKYGAFRKSLRRKGAKAVKLLYQHKSDMPVGVFDSIKEDEHGLYVKGRLALKTQAGRDAFELMKMGALDGLSIGFKPNPKATYYDKRTKKRMLEEVELMEISLVTFPMNQDARIRQVKGEDVSIREWENGLRDAFGLSRSESKMAAKAVHDAFTQREVEEDADLVQAVQNLGKIFNSWRT